jgi:hypothetical protein
MPQTLLMTIALLTAMTLTACGGGGASVQTSTSTYGQQLIDLKAAYDQGIISEKEYKNGREEILDRMDD